MKRLFLLVTGQRSNVIIFQSDEEGRGGSFVHHHGQLEL